MDLLCGYYIIPSIKCQETSRENGERIKDKDVSATEDVLIIRGGDLSMARRTIGVVCPRECKLYVCSYHYLIDVAAFRSRSEHYGVVARNETDGKLYLDEVAVSHTA